MEGFWNRVFEFLEPTIGQSAVDALKNLDVSEKISWLQVKLPRARLLIEISESRSFIYKPIDELLPQLKEAVNKAEIVIAEFESQKQRLEGSNWRIQGELLNNFSNWISNYPDNVVSAHCMLDHVCNEMENLCSMLDILKNPNQFNIHISRICATLPRAKLLIERSECWRLKHKSIDELLPQLKEAVYKAEIEKDDVESMKRILEGAECRVEGELLNYLRNWMTVVLEKAKIAQGNLDCVCKEMKNLCKNYNIPKIPSQFGNTARPITTSRHRDEPCGRDKELNDAIRLLRVPESGSCGRKRVRKKRNSGLYIPENSSNVEKKRRLAILPIVGMGGVGKTTLAQMIYKDKRVLSYFDLRIWICVSDKFDRERLMKEIIECASGKNCNVSNLNKIEETLEETLKSKRVLLVLDDIWSKDWQNLLGPINESSEGSVIILTTRSSEHLQCTGVNMTILNSIFLEGLEEEIYWDFFRSCSGLEVTSDNYCQLESIAIEICHRLKGSPLAAKTLGGLLKNRINERDWIAIRDSKMWELKQEEHDIMPALQLSYQHLPSHLKKCFSFCSLYPKDHELSAIELAKLWIMEGFIPTENDNLKHMEDVALGYFQDLKNGCFFLKKTTNVEYEHWIYEKHVIHDLMHDVCQSITTEECYCLQDGEICLNKDNIHHLAIFKRPSKLRLREVLEFKKVHTLLVPFSNYGINAIKSWCRGLTDIRHLSLPYCNITELPENIGNLKHLQYNTPIEKLPDSFCTLYNLQHLDMWSCDNFSKSEGFPNGSNNLIGLQFFRPPLHLVHFLTDKPNLIRAMQLYDLDYDVYKHGENKIENLKHLTGVRGSFYIKSLENALTKKAAEEAELNKQEFVDTLSLDMVRTIFSWKLPSRNNEIHSEVLEGSRPHHNLRVLEIFNYGGAALASWMGDNLLSNLRRVFLSDCSICSVSQLPRSITELKIVSCGQLTSLMDCLRPKLLPELKCLNLSLCHDLESLPVESFSGFESLEKLCIKYCFMLTCPTKMVLPPSIKVLKLKSCGELENSIPSCLENLSSLEKLSLFNCQRIVSIPDEVMRNLKSLKSLYVENCQNLISLGDEEFLKSLKHCVIKKCPKLKKTRRRNPDGRQLSDVPSSSNAGKRKARARK
ncbi:Disease resistance protein (CC-NBS-LRR class) family [Rhynchospora pubera]|uniref:Disease resistance protein (CC-NBS-LRR class) family n=1 Tax=Rhynchospora pubera TaxID=906938 RepID=A0AAV8D1W6_9POAL|nr:Disease resistance protein (CC-NBS-LRR class) family [Rhynchospora pubera]